MESGEKLEVMTQKSAPSFRGSHGLCPARAKYQFFWYASPAHVSPQTVGKSAVRDNVAVSMDSPETVQDTNEPTNGSLPDASKCLILNGVGCSDFYFLYLQ